MKSVGLLFLALIPTLYGFFKGEEIRRSVKTKRALIDFIQTMQNEISLYHREQKAIFLAYEDPMLEKIGFLSHLKEEVEKSPCLALQRSFEFLLTKLQFSSLESRAMTEFGNSFGMQSHASQLKDFDRLLVVLKSEDEKRQKDLAGQIKLNRAMGITVGLGIYIMLI